MRAFFLYLSLSVLLSLPLKAQLSIYPAQVKREVTLTADDFGYEETLKFKITNTSNESLRLRWDREVVFSPLGWETQVCDKESSYPYYVGSNIDPLQGINTPVELAAGESFDFYLTIQPFNRTGQCHIRLPFRTIEDTKTVLAEADVRFTIIDSKDGARLRADGGRTRLFPNPVVDRFFINNLPDNLSRLDVYNTLGSRVRSFAEPQRGESFGVADLPQGVYLVSLVDASGKTVRTLRLLKREFRP